MRLLLSILVALPLCAAEMIVTGLPAPLQEAAAQTNLGDRYFRQGEFAEAERCYRAAMQADPQYGWAYWGLGRVEAAQFHRRSAREQFARAYALAPQEPAIVMSYAGTAPNAQDEARLLSRYIEASPGEAAPVVRERLALLQKLQGREPGALASSYQPYRIALRPYSPLPGSPAGLSMQVQVNGRGPLRLIFDTGAKGIVLTARAAGRLPLEKLHELRVGGFGQDGARQAFTGLAETVSIGELTFRDCLIDVVDRPLGDGADGVIGGDLFAPFLLRLDAKAHVLDLQPFPGEAPNDRGGQRVWQEYDRPASKASNPQHLTAYQLGHLLLVRAGWKPRTSGLFLVDTGAAFSSVSLEVARELRQDKLQRVSLQGAGGVVQQAARLTPTRLWLSDEPVVDPELIALDLQPASRHEGIEISGLLGYSLMRHSVLTINYRDGLVQLGGK